MLHYNVDEQTLLMGGRYRKSLYEGVNMSIEEDALSSMSAMSSMSLPQDIFEDDVFSVTNVNIQNIRNSSPVDMGAGLLTLEGIQDSVEKLYWANEFQDAWEK